MSDCCESSSPRRHLLDPRLVSTFGDLGQQRGQRLAQVADDGDIWRYILADFGPVDLKVDNLGLLGEAVQIARDAIVKTHAQGNQHVTALDRTIGVCLAVHAGHAQVERMRLRDVARAQQCGHHRNVGLLDQLQQRLSCAGELDAVAGHDQRAIGLVDQFGSLIDLAAVDLPATARNRAGRSPCRSGTRPWHSVHPCRYRSELDPGVLHAQCRRLPSGLAAVRLCRSPDSCACRPAV